MKASQQTRHLGVDTGGTFTDLVEIAADGRIKFDKAFSTPAAPEQGIIDVLESVAAANNKTVVDYLAATRRFTHGTTVSTNSLIQRRGACVGLITTCGFEDTLEIARGPIGRAGGIPQSKAMDFLHTEPPPPLVPRGMVRGIGERTTVSGEVISPLNESAVETAIQDLVEAGMESLAVCLIWSFRNPEHEKAVRRIAARVAPALPVSLSSEIAPRMGEFERMMTTVVNAFIGPVTERYIGSLQQRLGGLGLEHPVQVMKSSGGVTLPDQIAAQAVSVVNSGPIGGLVAARHVGGLLGHKRIITADMGGTSFDVGLVADGVFEEETTPFLDQGVPVHIPSIKIVTIGAGGGSIAWTDGYRLQVGPQSAGSDPGPACYDRDGEEPTVTDALVLLGIIDPENFFGGRFALDRNRARTAIEEKLAKPLAMDCMAAAAGIYEVVTARMGDLIRKATVESGQDPREFALFAYGGASAAHAAVFARQLGIRQLILPYAAPVFSALGAALSDVIYGHVKSEPMPLTELPETVEAIDRTLTELEELARGDMKSSGITDPDEIEMNFRIEMRYQGQMNEVSLPWSTSAFSLADVSALRTAFESHYQKRFGAGTIRRETPLELISFRAEAVKPVDKPGLAQLFEADNNVTPFQPSGHREVYLHGTGWVDTGVYAFDTLRPGPAIDGPAIIERDNTTAWLPPGAVATLDVYGNLEINPGTGT